MRRGFRIVERSRENGRLGRLGRRLLGGNINMLPVIRAVRFIQGNQRGWRGGGAGVQIALGNAQADGRAVFVSGNDERPAARQNNQVAIRIAGLWPVLSERGNRDINQPWIVCRQLVIAQAVFGQVPGLSDSTQEFCALGQAPKNILAFRPRNIESDPPLIAVIGPPVERVFRIFLILIEGPQLAGRGASGGLDFNDISAEIGQDLAAQQAALRCQVKDSIRVEHSVTPALAMTEIFHHPREVSP